MEDEAMFCRSHGAQLLSIRAELFRDEAITVTSHQVAQVRHNLYSPPPPRKLLILLNPFLGVLVQSNSD